MEMTDLRQSHLWPRGKSSLPAFSFVPHGMMVFLSSYVSKVTFIMNTARKSSHLNHFPLQVLCISDVYWMNSHVIFNILLILEFIQL